MRLAAWHLSTLHAALRPWQDEEFTEKVEKLEADMARLERNGGRGWPRPRLPSWPHRFYTLLIELAKRNDLLDIEYSEDLDKL